MEKEEVLKTANRLIRKYDWYVSDINNGYRLTVTDGVEDASVDITTGEDIEAEIKRLIEAVDEHKYPKLG